MAGIVGDDHVGASREGCRDDVAVTSMDLIRNNRREPLRSWGHRLGEGGLHLLTTSPKPLGMLGPSLGQAVDDLVEDLTAPSRTIETALSEPEEDVADDPRVEDARVEERDVSHGRDEVDRRFRGDLPTNRLVHSEWLRAPRHDPVGHGPCPHLAGCLLRPADR